MKTQYTHIRFELSEERPKTQVWSIYNNLKGEFLGNVVWHPGWRQYVTEIVGDVYLSESCHNDMAHFLRQVNEEHKK